MIDNAFKEIKDKVLKNERYFVDDYEIKDNEELRKCKNDRNG